MTSSLGGIEMVMPDPTRPYHSSVPHAYPHEQDISMTDTEYFRASYEQRFHSEQQSVSCPEDFERKIHISDCTSFLDTQRLDRDKIEESLSLIGFLFTLVSLILFILDTGSDVTLAYFLYKSTHQYDPGLQQQQHLLLRQQEQAEHRSHQQQENLMYGQWFKETVIILISSGIIVNLLSLKWYVAVVAGGKTLYKMLRCSRTSGRKQKHNSHTVIAFRFLSPHHPHSHPTAPLIPSPSYCHHSTPTAPIITNQRSYYYRHFHHHQNERLIQSPIHRQEQEHLPVKKRASGFWFNTKILFRIFVHLILMGPILRYFTVCFFSAWSTLFPCVCPEISFCLSLPASFPVSSVHRIVCPSDDGTGCTCTSLLRIFSAAGKQSWTPWGHQFVFFYIRRQKEGKKRKENGTKDEQTMRQEEVLLLGCFLEERSERFLFFSFSEMRQELGILPVLVESFVHPKVSNTR